MCAGVDCGVEVENDTVAGLLEKALESFCEEIERVNREQFACLNMGVPPMQRNILEIDTDCEDSEGRAYLKIINNTLQDAYAVYLDIIVAHYRDGILSDLVKALKTGELTILYGVTRIVGFYSRVSNWNKSKANIINGKVGGELGDRMKGNYWNSQRVNTGIQPLQV